MAGSKNHMTCLKALRADQGCHLIGQSVSLLPQGDPSGHLGHHDQSGSCSDSDRAFGSLQQEGSKVSDQRACIVRGPLCQGPLCCNQTVAELFSEEQFDAFFPNRNGRFARAQGFYQYQDFILAAEMFAGDGLEVTKCRSERLQHFLLTSLGAPHVGCCCTFQVE